MCYGLRIWSWREAVGIWDSGVPIQGVALWKSLWRLRREIRIGMPFPAIRIASRVGLGLSSAGGYSAVFVGSGQRIYDMSGSGEDGAMQTWDNCGHGPLHPLRQKIAKDPYISLQDRPKL